MVVEGLLPLDRRGFPVVIRRSQRRRTSYFWVRSEATKGRGVHQDAAVVAGAAADLCGQIE
ncbi:hypothetical protein AR540_17485 [Pseudomonas sp. EpS/L25]|nr:hypothetical protein AR540_17485 [Pseudomonas sp. EpS/L25]